GTQIYIDNGTPGYTEYIWTGVRTGLQDTVVLAKDTIGFRRVVPVGVNSLVVGNVELRLRSPFRPELLQFTMFTDAGEVWNRGQSQIKEVKLKVTPGIQL